MQLAYGYCRYSSDNQNEASIEQQKEELKKYANDHNIKIIHFYCDEAKSGTKDNREEFQHMISDCTKKKKEVDAVLVWKTDRFARNTQDSLFYKYKLDKVQIKLISITQPIDNSTPEGNLMYTILAGMDEYYSQNLASNVRRALKFNANQCLTNGGTAPLGYDIVDRKYVINEEEAPIVKLIYTEYLSGKSYYDIINMLNKRGYKTKKNLPFKKNSLYEILHNEKYIGTYIYNKGTGNKRHIVRDDMIKVENAFEPIISKEMFYKVQEQTKSNQKNTGQYKAKNVYLLSGLIFCGKCGSRYCGQTTHKTKNGKTYESSFYVCGNRNKVGKCNNHRIKKDEIENFIINSLIETILNGKNINELAQNIEIQYNNLKSDNSELLKISKKKLAEVKDKLDKTAELLIETGNKTLIKKLEEYEEEQESLEKDIAFYETTATSSITAKDVTNILKQDINLLKNASKEEMKNIIRKYISRITVFEDKLQIDYTFSNNISIRTFEWSSVTSTRHICDFSIFVKIEDFIVCKRRI